jgi:S-DNA-T family DNA segregation ATPase FtsK/SpoIIIE
VYERAGTERTRGTTLAVGCRFDDLSTAFLHVPDGEHVLVVGPAGSGRTSALAHLVEAWSARYPTGRVIRDPYLLDAGTGTLPTALGRHGERVLLVIDDAERFADTTGGLARALEVRRASLTVVAAGRADDLRAGYGTWITQLRRSRLGFVMAAAAPADGDVLGAIVPRRPPIPPRPGLAWMVDADAVTLVQLAARPDAQPDDQPNRQPADQLGSIP